MRFPIRIVVVIIFAAGLCTLICAEPSLKATGKKTFFGESGFYYLLHRESGKWIIRMTDGWII